MEPVKLYREGRWPQITRAILREDGVHFIEHDGTERKATPQYRSLAEMNAALTKMHYGTFAVVEHWPKETHP